LKSILHRNNHGVRQGRQITGRISAATDARCFEVQNDWAAIERAWTEPGPQGENLRFQDFPAFHMMALASLAKANVSRACLDPAGLSVPEWRLITTVVGEAPVAFAQIAALTMMDKGQISRTLRTAQEKGLVATEVQPLERRPPEAAASSIGRVMVRITEKGRRVYERVMPEAQRAQLRLIELMSPDERRTVVDLARRFYAALNPEPGSRG
jgi:DNA-binding MarR family transcriptional regulator